MASAAPNNPPPATAREAGGRAPIPHDPIDGATGGAPLACPQELRRHARPVMPSVGGRALRPLAPLTPLLTARASIRPRFPSLADLAVVLMLLALVTGFLAALFSRESRQRDAGASCAGLAGDVAGWMAATGSCPIPRRQG